MSASRSWRVKVRLGGGDLVVVVLERVEAVDDRLQAWFQCIFSNPASDRRLGRLGHATLHHQPMQLSAGEPRDRNAKLARELARDRLDLRQFLRGENDAGDPRAVCPSTRPADLVGTVIATSRRPPAPCPPSPRSPRSSIPATRATSRSRGTETVQARSDRSRISPEASTSVATCRNTNSQGILQPI